MLKVDDSFKVWMRRRLADKEYADRIMHALTDYEDCTLISVHPHAALPAVRTDDPEVMIGLIKGHDNKMNEDFLLAIFGEWDRFKDLAQAYIGHLWSLYNPVKPIDFEHLPRIIEVAFSNDESEEPIIKRRWTLTVESDGLVTSKDEYEDFKINIVNTRLDSDIIKTITGEKTEV